MSGKIEERYKCPFCGISVAPVLPRIANDEGVEYSLTKRRTRIWFHRSCYLQNIKRCHYES